MSYVIVNLNATKSYLRLYKAPGNYSFNCYETLRGAKAVATKLNKNTRGLYFAVSYEEYDLCFKLPVEYKTVKNLLSGKDVVIAEGTPLCCDPSSETYWST